MESPKSFNNAARKKEYQKQRREALKDGLTKIATVAGFGVAGAAGWYVVYQVITAPMTQGHYTPHGNYSIEDVFHSMPR